MLVRKYTEYKSLNAGFHCMSFLTYTVERLWAQLSLVLDLSAPLTRYSLHLRKCDMGKRALTPAKEGCMCWKQMCRGS